MNTATYRLQTISALSFALLISGTTSASHRSDSSSAQLHSHGYEDVDIAQVKPRCMSAVGAIVTHLGNRQVVASCRATGHAVEGSTPIRLAKPLSGSPYPRSSESIRYSF